KEMYTCAQKKCPADKLAVTRALVPHTLFDWGTFDALNCANWPNYQGVTPEYPLCCDPPLQFDEDNWPVHPSYLWSDRAPVDEANVRWEWNNTFANNQHSIQHSDLVEDPCSYPYGFVMLTGPPGSINTAFNEDFSVMTRNEPVGVQRRSLITTNTSVLEGVF